MVLTKAELVALLESDVRVFQHLIGKIPADAHDYRPTPKQRSTAELVKYMSFMGPTLAEMIRTGTFDEAAWGAAEQAAMARSFDDAVAVFAGHPAAYARTLDAISDAELREDVDMFGKASRGAHLVTWVLNGGMAYRMQLFLYLKASGRPELNTMNLWSGADG